LTIPLAQDYKRAKHFNWGENHWQGTRTRPKMQRKDLFPPWRSWRIWRIRAKLY